MLAAVETTALDSLMRELAEGQHSLVARRQLRTKGVHRHELATRRDSPDWERVTARVLRLIGAAETDLQRAMAAVLDAGPGTVLSHRSAAALWDLPGFDLEDLHVSRRRSVRGPTTRLARIHRPLLLSIHHCTMRRKIPVTTLVRTVFDLAGTEHPARTERALHAALRIGLPWEAMERYLLEVAEHGRPGIQLMRQLVADHRGKPARGSGLEVRFLRILTSAGLPEPRRQVDLGGDQWIGRVDFLYEDVRLVIEVNGDQHHTSRLDVERDQRRTGALVAAGYTVLPVSEQLVRQDPAEVARLVHAARQRAA